MGDISQGLGLMVIGMGVVLFVLVLLALATVVLELVFRPQSERKGEGREAARGEEAGSSALGLEEAGEADEAYARRLVALAAVGLYLQDRERAHVYVPLRTTGGQWKYAGRLKSLRG